MHQIATVNSSPITETLKKQRNDFFYKNMIQYIRACSNNPIVITSVYLRRQFSFYRNICYSVIRHKKKQRGSLLTLRCTSLTNAEQNVQYVMKISFIDQTRRVIHQQPSQHKYVTSQRRRSTTQTVGISFCLLLFCRGCVLFVISTLMVPSWAYGSVKYEYLIPNIICVIYNHLSHFDTTPVYYVL